jgi:1-phosphofructokinase
MTLNVVTITLNPALDLTGNVDALNLGAVNLIGDSNLRAAGKGVNVAKVLSDLGAKVTVTGFLGRENQEMFCQLFKNIDAVDEFIRVDGRTRINVKLVEKNGAVSELNFPGVAIAAEDIQPFENTLFRLAQHHDYFVIAGSLPTGISPALCSSWIAQLQQLGKKVLFDSSGDALAFGLKARPWLIKPNHEELGQYVGKTMSSVPDCQQAGASLASMPIENVVISLGANGLLWLHNKEWLYAKPPRVEVVSTVGAGDTLVAGLCWGHMQNMPKPELLTFATALSALAVSQVGVGVSDITQVKNLQQRVQLLPCTEQTTLD